MHSEVPGRRNEVKKKERRKALKKIRRVETRWKGNQLNAG